MRTPILFSVLLVAMSWGCNGGDDDGNENYNHNNNANDTTCTDASECDSGFCTDGVCCDSRCDGPCETCGQPGASGTCTPLPAGTDCGEAACSDNVYTTYACDGAGTCDASDLDCADLATECTAQTCDPATGCVAAHEQAGTPCGSATDTLCNPADGCDGAGACVQNITPDGVWCTGCGSADGECACTAGSCGSCSTYAAVNTFTTPESIDGWQQTGSGGWGLYLEAPGSIDAATPIPFGGQVFGTDGSREPPYPGVHTEEATMITTAALVPATLSFDSWHMDEGGEEYDMKRISLSVDGGQSWHVLVDCTAGPNSTLPFCSDVSTRSATDWDHVTLDASPFAGQLGQLMFWYDSVDDCCEGERGWFIDNLTFGAGCACTMDADCAALSTTCATAVCDPTNGTCEYAPVASGTACGDASTSSCDNADQCDGLGYCSPNHAPALTPCDDCPAGAGNCWGCSDGICQDEPDTGGGGE